MDELDKEIIRKLQEDLPLVKNPYQQMAEELKISERTLLNRIRCLKDQKKLRRIGAILHHRSAGMKANAMVVWEVPKDRIAYVIPLMTACNAVSHCYQRQTLPQWPYNIYTMIHAEAVDICEELIKKLAALTHLDHYKILYSTKELKKSSMKYFTE